MGKWTERRWGMAAPSARVHIISIDVPTSRRSRRYWMLFKRSADIIIKGHHRTGRPCGLEAAGEADGRPLKKRRRGRRKAVFKVDTGAVRFSHVHCALFKTANNFLSQRNFEGRGGVWKINAKERNTVWGNRKYDSDHALFWHANTPLTYFGICQFNRRLFFPLCAAQKRSAATPRNIY